MISYLKSLDPTQINTLVTLLGIFTAIIVPLIAFLFRRSVLNVVRSIILRIFSGHLVVKNDYYSHDFVLKNIKKSKHLIRIMCVRNERVSEPDIIEAMKKFITEKGGIVEILALHPNFSDCVTEECMCVLPAPPKDKKQFAKQVSTNHSKIIEFHKKLGQEEKKRFKCRYFRSLPLIHMCQFDNMIYIGFQLFHRDQIDNSLLNYSVMIKTKTNLGKQIVKQFQYVMNNKTNHKIQSTRQMSRTKVST